MLRDSSHCLGGCDSALPYKRRVAWAAATPLYQQNRRITWAAATPLYPINVALPGAAATPLH